VDCSRRHNALPTSALYDNADEGLGGFLLLNVLYTKLIKIDHRAFHRVGVRALELPPRADYELRDDLRLFVPAVRAKFFASVSAVISLVLDTRFFDCWTISASFAFTRLVISRLSPVLGMCPPCEMTADQFALRTADATPSAPEVRFAF
jgi:hypothetical protein